MSNRDSTRDGMAYLAQVFALDPEEDAQAIVALRSERFTKQVEAHQPEPKADGEGESRREHDLERLRALRDGFWEFDDEELDDALDEAAATEQPDLLRWYRRLERAANARPSLLTLCEDDSIPKRFRELLFKLVVASPQEAVALRRSHLDRSPAKRSRRAVDRLIKRYPHVAALEGEFLTKLRGIAADRKLSSRKVAATIAGISVFWFWIYIIIRFLIGTTFGV